MIAFYTPAAQFLVAGLQVGCTDVDDALHVRPLEGGCVEVGVHIADVRWETHLGIQSDCQKYKTQKQKLVGQCIDLEGGGGHTADVR